MFAATMSNWGVWLPVACIATQDIYRLHLNRHHQIRNQRLLSGELGCLAASGLQCNTIHIKRKWEDSWTKDEERSCTNTLQLQHNARDQAESGAAHRASSFLTTKFVPPSTHSSFLPLSGSASLRRCPHSNKYHQSGSTTQQHPHLGYWLCIFQALPTQQHKSTIRLYHTAASSPGLLAQHLSGAAHTSTQINNQALPHSNILTCATGSASLRRCPHSNTWKLPSLYPFSSALRRADLTYEHEQSYDVVQLPSLEPFSSAVRRAGFTYEHKHMTLASSFVVYMSHTIAGQP